MLYGLNIAKIVFPLLTLPYLTRVLSVNAYGMVAYVKAIMQYVQIIIDFGFMLSGTRQIVMARDDQAKINEVISKNIYASLLLSAISFIGVLVVMFNSSILSGGYSFTILSFLTVMLSIALVDFYFRGIEKMEVITIRFFVMKLISTIATLVFVRGDNTLILMPIFDISGSLWAAMYVFKQLKFRDVRLIKVPFKHVSLALRESFVYFSSNIASTAFNGLNTIVIGFMLPSSQVAFWGICLQIVGAIQGLYSPISDAIYPHMVQTRNIEIVKKFLIFLIPLAILGSTFVYTFSEDILCIISGSKYRAAGKLLRMLTPVLVMGLISILTGWPTLGAIGKQKQTTFTTIISAVFQTLGIVILLCLNVFSLKNIAVLRVATECLLAGGRISYTLKYKREFAHSKVSLIKLRRTKD